MNSARFATLVLMPACMAGLLVASALRASAGETPPGMEDALRRGLALVTRAAGNWQKNKACFSCHRQTLPMLAMVEAARAGLPPDAAWLQSQAETTHRSMQASSIGDTVLVLIGLEKYATSEQRPRVAKAREAAGKWLAQTPLRDRQDRLWRLWGLHHLGGDDELKQRTLDSIRAAQRDDGGWAEDKDRQSDACSTGQTLFMLCKTGAARDDAAVVRARDYPLRTQHADGSWLAESHVKHKAQPYFENGDPHGEHQFLSTAATARAVAALAQLLPVK